MTLWQFLGFMLVMVGTLLGSMYWVTNVLEKRFDERFIQMEKSFDERFVQMEKRFEDLRQVVLPRRRLQYRDASLESRQSESRPARTDRRAVGWTSLTP